MTKPTQSRELILDILMEILEKGGYSHVVLRQALEKYQYLEKQDRALITRITEGTIEYRMTIDQVLNQCSKVPVEKMKPVIRTILRMSVYQIFWMDRIPDRAVCSEAVNLAVRRRFSGLKGFVNGVLRTIIREKDSFDFSDLSLRYSMPSWLIDMWQREYDSETVESMLRAFLEDRPTSVRCNLDRASMEEICSLLKGEGVLAEKSPLADHGLLISGYDYLEALSAFQKGWIQVQDASSALVGQAASPCAGDRILDVCGAPGGKSLDLADRLKGTGLVTVRDLTEQKVALIEDNIERSGFTNICAQVWDARDFDSRWEKQADIVIADLPCSGLGIIGKKPDIKYQASLEQIESLAALQREILSAVIRYIKPGGKLIYSTCTVSRKENQGQRDWILQEFPELEPLSLEKELGSSVQEPSLKEGYLQLLPGKHPCDGFFIAAFRKKEE